MWAIDEKSDFDYRVIVDTEETKKKLREFLKMVTDGKIQVLSIGTLDEVERDTGNDYGIVDLFFTPDDYLSGNIELATTSRLSCIKRIQEGYGVDYYEKVNWKTVFIDRFDTLYRNWEDMSDSRTPWFRAEKSDPNRERKKRIFDRLSLRASRTKAPEKYKEAFLNARKNLQVPSFHTFCVAFEQSNGALNITKNFKVERL